MRISIKKNVVFILSVLFIVSACDKDSDAPESGQITLSFNHTIDNQPLQVNNGKLYTNNFGEEYKVEKLKYYVSNVKLRNKKDGSYYSEPESYHLISLESDSNVERIAFEIPAGEYDQLLFSIGVDSLKNTSISYDGDLDPNNSMAWDWESGYKFFVLEGKYFTAETGPNGGALVFHIGENKNYRIFSMDLMKDNSSVKINGQKATINLNVAIDEMWKSPTEIKFDELHGAMFGENASKIADNYAQGMFSIDTILE